MLEWDSEVAVMSASQSWKLFLFTSVQTKKLGKRENRNMIQSLIAIDGYI
jgi:hypothetical protein